MTDLPNILVMATATTEAELKALKDEFKHRGLKHAAGEKKRKSLQDRLDPVLNAEATRLGVSPVTERMGEDWIEEELVEGPQAKGRRRRENPLWEYSAGTTERAVAVLRFKADDVKRFSALRLQLWLHETNCCAK